MIQACAHDLKMKESNLCNIVKNILEITLEGKVESNVEYLNGEMDVLHTCKHGLRTYYEIKSSIKQKQITKGISQVRKAMRQGQCEYGYVVTPESWYEVK